ncbi:GT4 family glycosyltransferase PelF [Jannaschia ovalis]|uniref:GT4 family glycosyltransferase PelF n=1 Tax=Jannaschia ovalis TaxID=3038773 RepID=A0ABY8LC79_9RHOB|nr:GT4 family glycosyltransferase PelF [Jannaschia sp. GRR-S6-38]WGH78736.1 GT4 family glycosyltransferase PelF [Jannaschia sp. GRR-S6-38]
MSASSPDTDIADVCLILEGCYPFVFGGVSSWTHTLIASLPETTFHVVSIQPEGADLTSKYGPLPNLIGQTTIILKRDRSLPRAALRGERPLADVLEGAFFEASAKDFAELIDLLPPSAPLRNARDAEIWNLARDMYNRLAPATSFQQFFWVWYTLQNSVMQVLQYAAPRAGVYHAISTGYAGLFGAAATRRTGRPLLLTEHGIYTNERTVELMASVALHDSFESDAYLSDQRPDARDVWIRAFESMGRLCYDSSSRITSLSRSAQAAQHRLGAAPEKTQVIANGIDLERFSGIQLKGPRSGKVVAFIGRVVSIKDVDTFIRAMDIVFQAHPDAEGWIVGPEDEEPEYARKCHETVASLGIGSQLKFLGMRDVAKIIAQVDMIVLTSLSEGQPLTLLEAGAAGLPCVATDVGSCRDIIEGFGDGPSDETPGGYITELMSPQGTAEAIMKLLNDPEEARRRGAALKARVRDQFGLEKMCRAYADLYEAHSGREALPDVSEA